MRRLALTLVLLAGCKSARHASPRSLPVCDQFLHHLEQCIEQLGPSTTGGQALRSQQAIYDKNWAYADPASLPELCARAVADSRASYPACAW